jgi:hypothetical protein
MNLWHFRSRNYRVDWVMALIYLGLVGSLLPLCGLYADYEAFNPRHEFKLLAIWAAKKSVHLMWRIITTEYVSCLWIFLVMIGTVGVQTSDKKVHPVPRFLCGLLRKCFN